MIVEHNEDMSRKKSKQKHVPLRTCVACRGTFPKQDLIRLVLITDDEVVVDETGKRNGRGAYLCRKRSCWERALKRGTLNRALRTQLSPESMTKLKHYAKNLPEANPDDEALAGSGCKADVRAPEER